MACVVHRTSAIDSFLVAYVFELKTAVQWSGMQIAKTLFFILCYFHLRNKHSWIIMSLSSFDRGTGKQNHEITDTWVNAWGFGRALSFSKFWHPLRLYCKRWRLSTCRCGRRQFHEQHWAQYSSLWAWCGLRDRFDGVLGSEIIVTHFSVPGETATITLVIVSEMQSREVRPSKMLFRLLCSVGPSCSWLKGNGFSVLKGLIREDKPS